MSHLEDLIAEYYDWSGHLVKKNIKVGRLAHGGWEMELDIIALDPRSGRITHVEPSIDAHSWAVRERRFAKKFEAGRRYILKDVFTWLDADTPIDQQAILINHPKGRDTLAGAILLSIDELMSIITRDVEACGIAAKNAISEQYPLLRTMQLSHNGYYRRL